MDVAGAVAEMADSGLEMADRTRTQGKGYKRTDFALSASDGILAVASQCLYDLLMLPLLPLALWIASWSIVEELLQW